MNNSEGIKSFDSKKEVLLEHLAAQYKLYREELRVHNGFAATSTTLLIILLFTELTAAIGKDNAPRPELLILIPLSLVWYGAILSLHEPYCGDRGIF